MKLKSALLCGSICLAGLVSAALPSVAQDIRQQYDVTQYEWTDYPSVVVYRYDVPELRRLYLLADPTRQLARAPIEGPDGHFVGKVRNVETSSNGSPLRIEVALNRMVSVWASPGHFRFDAEHHVLFTDLTRDQMWTLPGATVESVKM